MDLERKLTESYPGHLPPEVMLFTRDKTNASILVESEELSNEDCLRKLDLPDIPDSLLTCRFRGIDVTTSTHSVNVEKDVEALSRMCEKLKFPLDKIHFARTSLRVELGRHYGPDADDERPVFYVAGSRNCLMLSYHVPTNSTRAIVVNFIPAKGEEQLSIAMALTYAIQSFKGCFGHPGVLLLLFVEMVRLDEMEAYTSDSQTLREIGDKVTLKSANRIQTLQRLRNIARMACDDKFVLDVLRRVLDLCQKISDTFCHDDAVCKDFMWRVDQFRDQVDLDTSFLQSIYENATNQQDALNNIINMTDGSSMKTIAVITMAFLPPTFVASFFAMPMFEWNHDLNQIVSRQFWIYWVVAIPLTGVIFLLWLLWWYWHTIRNEYDDENAHPLEDLKAWWKKRASTPKSRHSLFDPIEQKATARQNQLRVQQNREFIHTFYRRRNRGKVATWVAEGQQDV